MLMSTLAVTGGTPVRATPFPNWPIHDQREIDAVVEAITSSRWGGNYLEETGFKTDEFAARFAAYHDARHGIPAMNGTVTMEVALRAAGIGPGDEVIVPPISWIATASAPLSLDAVPVFADVDPQTGSLDPAAVEAAVTDRSRAVIPVHLGGRPVDLDGILEVARRHNLIVIEDAAHAHGSQWRGRGIGSWGDFGSFSFQITKVMTAGEGGMLTTNDTRYAELCAALVNCGRIPRGSSLTESPWGWNYRLPELQGALLLAQFSRIEELTALRADNAAHLDRCLRELDGPAQPLPPDPRITRQAYYYFSLRYEAERCGGLSRKRFIEAVQAEGIPLGVGNPVIYKNLLFRPTAATSAVVAGLVGRGLDLSKVHCPNAERIAEVTGMGLSQHVLLGSHADVEDVVAAIDKVTKHADQLAVSA
ncbi:MAG: Aminotransferase DegT [Chloroflexi bacterium]|nr:Aminotransferase DegT [Chloroflexota bacterium]